MKRTLSFILVMLFILSAFNFNVYAESEININKDFYTKAEKYAEDNGIIGYPFDTGLGFTVNHKYEFYYKSSELIVFSIADEWNEDVACDIKNYRFIGHAYYGNCDNGLTVYDGENFYKISDAADKGIATLEFLAGVIPNSEKVDLQSYSDKFRPAVKSYVEDNGIDVADKEDVDSYINIYFDSTRVVLFGITDNSNKEQKINVNHSFYTYTLTNKSFGVEDSDAGFLVYYYGKIYKLSEAIEKEIIDSGTVVKYIPGEKTESDVLTRDDFNSLLEKYIESISAESRVKRYASGAYEGDIICDYYKHTDEIILFRIFSSYIWKCNEKIGLYTFSSGTKLSDDNPCGYCVYKDGVIYSLSQAYKKRIIKNDDLGKYFGFIATAGVDREVINDIITDYLQKLDISQSDPEDYSIIYKSDNDIVLIHGYLGCPTHGMSASEKFGDYYVTSSDDMFPYLLGYYVIYPKENTMYSLREAYDQKLSGVEDLFTNGVIGRRYGDADKNNKIDINDVTILQKYLAKIKTKEINISKDEVVIDEFYGNPVVFLDFNLDGKINISDATAIQKYLAKL